MAVELPPQLGYWTADGGCDEQVRSPFQRCTQPSSPIDKRTRQTYHAALQFNNGAMEVNNATMQARNAMMEVCKITMQARNATMEVYNVTMEACNATLQINKNVLTRYITRDYKKWPIFRGPKRRFWPWSRK